MRMLDEAGAGLPLWSRGNSANFLPTRRVGLVTDQGAANLPSASEQPVVLVIDDDQSMREALGRLLRSVGLRAEMYGSAQSFLAADLPTVPTCLVLDIRMPGQSGLDLQAELVREDIRIPIIFITGHGDVPMSVKALKAGAVDFLTKPFRDQDLLDAVVAALDRACRQRDEEKRLSGLRACFEALTPREKEIMTHVVDGLMNKQIAHELGVTEITVKIHRGNMMRKMGAKSLPDLVRMAGLLTLARR
jgi:FixJ family two-component response regulator